MTSNRSSLAPEGLLQGDRWGAWKAFWFGPVNPVGLHALRVVAGLVFLAWLLVLAGRQEAMFGLEGWFDREAYLEASRLPGGTPSPVNGIGGWSLLYLCGTDATLLTIAYWAAIGVLVLFTLGLWTRVTAVLTWLIVISFHASPATRFEADYLLVIVAFYLMIGYLFLGLWSRRLSLRERLLGPADTFLLAARLRRPETDEAVPSHAANLAVRLWQVHFALIVVVSGLHKLQMAHWWSGVAFWYPLHPPFETSAARIQAEVADATVTLIVLGIAQYIVLAWQLGFPLFAWRKGWARMVLVGGGLLGWAGSFFIFGQPLFGPVYFLGCLSYLTPAEWLWVPGKLASRTPVLAAAVPTRSEKVKAGSRM